MNRIYADFIKSDHKNRLVLTCLGTLQDLERENIVLQKGMKLLFYNDDVDAEGNADDLVVEGFVDYDDSNERWVATINWDDITNISQLRPDERARLRI
jgi:hypothetical protein